MSETNLESECEGSEGESTLECKGLDIGEGGLIGDGLDIGDEDGLIGNGFCFGLGSELSRMVIGVGFQSRREWFTTIGFGFGFRLSQMVLPEQSRMVRNNWVCVWVQTVANGFTRAVANGSQRLGSDSRKWFCQSRHEWFPTIGLGLGSDCCEWFC